MMPEGRVEVESFELEEPERYLAVLAKYGKSLITTTFNSTEFSKTEINRDTGLDLEEEIKFLNELEVLERRYLEEGSDSEPYFYSLSDEFEEMAINSMAYIGNNYSGKIWKFVEEFSESDLSNLRKDWNVDI